MTAEECDGWDREAPGNKIWFDNMFVEINRSTRLTETGMKLQQQQAVNTVQCSQVPVCQNGLPVDSVPEVPVPVCQTAEGGQDGLGLNGDGDGGDGRVGRVRGQPVQGRGGGGEVEGVVEAAPDVVLLAAVDDEAAGGNKDRLCTKNLLPAKREYWKKHFNGLKIVLYLLGIPPRTEIILPTEALAVSTGLGGFARSVNGRKYNCVFSSLSYLGNMRGCT